MFDKEKPSEQLKVEVYYTKGGDHSYVSSNPIPRGLKLSFTKVELADTGSGFKSESFMMFSDEHWSIHLKTMARANARVEKEYSDKIASLKEYELLDIYKNKDITKLTEIFK